MQEKKSLIPFDPSAQAATSWLNAYRRFLFSGEESALLKIAPLALIGILPLDLLSNIVPVIGELDDLSYIVALVVIGAKTADRVRRYR